MGQLLQSMFYRNQYTRYQVVHVLMQLRQILV